ncbi:lactate utilization protein [Paroceanicella profunda]|uniref:Lactate utilization protein n=1 Tax=Paroceanicella profunda TaxID=2579971 RepID=A0A5B8FY79_9RHOB|nr:LUD domain-containing protein [Paroceanicella profunda]QDL91569.1 lactate utilization protein [Paroceanicella profunda]
MSARERILGRLRTALADPERTEADRQSAVAARLRGEGPRSPVPGFAQLQGQAALTQFMTRLEAVDATVSRVSSLAELPRALSHELRNRNLPSEIRHGTDPIFEGLDWGTITATTGIGRIEEPATLSHARFGMAETGTLVLTSGPENPVTLTFLGETHFVVVFESAVRAGLEEVWAGLRGAGIDPRTVNMVTGPSRSADIGQKLQLGAHGPVALHVFVVSDPQGDLSDP